MMIEGRMLEQIDDSASAAASRIGASKNNAAHPDMDKGAGAHHARLFGHVEIAIHETPISDGRFGLRQREHLGMRRGVFEQLNLIVSAANYFTGSNNHRADRNFVGFARLCGQSESLAHKRFIILHFDVRVHTSIPPGLGDLLIL